MKERSRERCRRHGHAGTPSPLLFLMARSFSHSPPHRVSLLPPPLPPPPPTPASPPPPPIQSQWVLVRVGVREFQPPPSVEVTFMRKSEPVGGGEGGGRRKAGRLWCASMSVVRKCGRGYILLFYNNDLLNKKLHHFWLKEREREGEREVGSERERERERDAETECTQDAEWDSSVSCRGDTYVHLGTTFLCNINIRIHRERERAYHYVFPASLSFSVPQLCLMLKVWLRKCIVWQWQLQAYNDNPERTRS